MRRFIVNRTWTWGLVLLLGVAGVVTLPRIGLADPGGAQIGGEDSGSPGTYDPTGSGDPDVPMGGAKGASRPAVRGGRAVMPGEVQPGTHTPVTPQAIWLFKFRIALQVFRAVVFHD